MEMFFVIVAAAVMIGGWMGYLLHLQKKLGYNPNGPDFIPGTKTIQPDRTERPLRDESAPIHTITPAGPALAAPGPVVQAVQSPRLSGNETWQKLQTAIHLLIVGPTNAGKSTTARAVLWGRVEQGDQVLILDPHAAPDEWSGVPAVGVGRDYATIDQTMLALIAEMTERYEQRAIRPGYQAQPLTIFIDEWPSIQTHCKATASAFITQLAQEGRKVAMRLVMLTQSNRVESLGIAGKGDIRDNFTTLLLAEKALELCPASSALDRPAAMSQNGTMTPAYIGFAPTVAARPMPYVVLWQAVADEVASTAHDDSIPDGMDPDLYRRFVNKEDLLEPLRTSSKMGGVENLSANQTARTSTENTLSADTYAVKLVHAEPAAARENVPGDDLSIAIRALVDAGLSRNKVTTLLAIPGGRGEQLKRVKVALGESETGAV